MQIELEELVHPRITEACAKLLEGGHFQHAALEAMKQVEIALREKSLAPSDRFGDRLVKWVLGSGQHMTLSVPLGEDLQDHARLLFRGAFSYYRNYAAHDGAKIDRKTCIRILMLGSELLDLIDASRRSFETIGGVQGLIDAGIFKDSEEFGSLLTFLDGRTILEHDFGAHLEDLYEHGFNELQQEALFDFGLVKYQERMAENYLNGWTLVGWIELTGQGNKMLSELGVA
jgi:uncharacterized protein (TIGR02391 family)